MKLLTIIGTRPQFIKMPLLSQKLSEHNIEEIIIHSGQHFDNNMSQNIFDNLNLPKPKYHLNLSGENKSMILGNMISEISKIILIEKPNYIMVYGDCDTTLAGTLAANKLDYPVIHVESGLRSYDKTMPEEINRIMVDHISEILFCPDDNSVKNLEKEGLVHNDKIKIYNVGDLMVELLRKNIDKIKFDDNILEKLDIINKKYYLLTVHRKSNTTIEKLQYIFDELGKLEDTIIYPIHPRVKMIVEKIKVPENIKIIEPVEYFDMMVLLYHCQKLITDSGGLQKEAYELCKP